MTLFALVPLLTVMFTVLSLVPSFSHLSVQIEQIIFDNMLPSSGSDLYGYLREFTSQAKLLSAPGIIMLIVTAYLMLINIEKVFNRIWSTPGRRTGLSSFLLYWAVLSLGPLLIGAGLMINTYLLSIQFIAESEVSSGLLYPILEYLPWLMTAIAFTLLYKAVPNCQVFFKNALIGGIVATIVFELAKNLFGLIVSNSSFRNIYGAFSIVPLFLLWIYFCWMIILGGAEFVRATETFESEAHRRNYSSTQALLMALWYFYRAQRQGLSLSDKRMIATGLSDEQWRVLRDRMLAKSMIAVTQSGRYVLTRDLSQLSLWQLLEEHLEHATPDVQEPDKKLVEHHPWLNEYVSIMQEVEKDNASRLSFSVADLFNRAEKK